MPETPCLAAQLLAATDRPRPLVSRPGQMFSIPSAALVLHLYRQAHRPPQWWEAQWWAGRWFGRSGSASRS